MFAIVVDYILHRSVDNISTNGLLLTPTRSTRHPSKYITDLDYADNISPTPDNLENAVSLLHSLGSATNSVGLHMNCNKTEYMLVKGCEHKVVKSLNRKYIKTSQWLQVSGDIYIKYEKRFRNQKSTGLSSLQQASHHNDFWLLN